VLEWDGEPIERDSARVSRNCRRGVNARRLACRREQMLLAGMPAALFAVFALVPGVSRNIFRTWSCKTFLANDDDGSSVELLVMQMSVECDTEEHGSITSLAAVYLIFGEQIFVLFGHQYLSDPVACGVGCMPGPSPSRCCASCF
jgi:hypothetical protein